MSAKVAVDLKLFQYIVAKNGPITAAELANLSGAEELLIGTVLSITSISYQEQVLISVLVRILRPLAATGFIIEAGVKTWTASPVSHAMATNEIAAGHRMM